LSLTALALRDLLHFRKKETSSATRIERLEL